MLSGSTRVHRDSSTSSNTGADQDDASVTSSENLQFISGVFGMVRDLNPEEQGDKSYVETTDKPNTAVHVTHTVIVHNVNTPKVTKSTGDDESSNDSVERGEMRASCEINNTFIANNAVLSENIIVNQISPRTSVDELMDESWELNSNITTDSRCDAVLSENIIVNQVIPSHNYIHESQNACEINNNVIMNAHNAVLSENIIVNQIFRDSDAISIDHNIVTDKCNNALLFQDITVNEVVAVEAEPDDNKPVNHTDNETCVGIVADNTPPVAKLKYMNELNANFKFAAGKPINSHHCLANRTQGRNNVNSGSKVIKISSDVSSEHDVENTAGASNYVNIQFHDQVLPSEVIKSQTDIEIDINDAGSINVGEVNKVTDLKADSVNHAGSNTLGYTTVQGDVEVNKNVDSPNVDDSSTSVEETSGEVTCLRSENANSKVRFSDKIDVSSIPVPFDIIVTKVEYTPDGNLLVTRKKEPELSYETTEEGKSRTISLGLPAIMSECANADKSSVNVMEEGMEGSVTLGENQERKDSQERKDKSLRDSRSNVPPPLVIYDEGDYALIPDDVEACIDEVGPIVKENEMMQLPNKGILDMERQMRGMVDSDGGGLMHVPGPVDGNPYAQIDHTLKDKCRPKPPTIDTSYDLTRGIEDLEDLLVDLGHVGTTINNNKTTNQSELYNKNKIHNTTTGKNNSYCVPEIKVPSPVMNGQAQLANESYVKFPSCQGRTNSYNHSPSRNGVTSVQNDDVFTESPTVNDLLFVLDKPSTPRSKNYIKKTQNMSSYDNMDDSFYSTSSDIDLSDFRECNSNTSLEAAMEINPGTVARHVKNLQLKLSSTDNKPNAPKHGVPLAGLVSPTAFHGQHSPTYSNGAVPSVYKQNHVIQKKVEIDVGHQGHQSSPYYTRYDGLRANDSCDYSEIQNDDDHDVFSKRSTLLSRSDSAYGESMRSSSSSPPLTTPSTPRIDNSYIHEEERKDTCSGESYSPKSDGVNEISSGIASRSSSMTSLDSSHGDNKHTESKSTWKQRLSPITKNGNGSSSSRSCSVDTIDGTTQTSPTPGGSPSYAIENEIRATSINEDHQLNPRSLDMKMPISIRTDNNSCSTPRGILKTMDISDRKHLNDDHVFMKGNVPTPYHQPIETHNSPRCTERSTASLGSSPDDFGVHLVDQPAYNNARKLSVGSSTGSEGAHSPRSTGSTSGSLGKQTMRRSMRSRGGSASSNSSVSSAELFHEIARNPSVKFDKETMSLWYRPKISRDEATSILRDKEPGTFVVRDSQSFEGGFGLAVKVETPPTNVLQQVGGDITKIDFNSELVRHYLIEPCKKGVRLKGSSNETAFPSLMALIYQHSLTKMSLPVELLIPTPADQNEDLQRETLTEAEILEKGACCNLVYLGGVDVESLTGDGAIHYAMNKVTSQNIQAKTTTINIKVNHKGITLTDNQRRIFFRRHYIMKNVIHCGIDPKGRKISLKTLVENCDREVECFGFVVRKETKSLITLPGNECHICAEMDPNQPSSAVINFIHKAMRYSKV